MGPFIYSGFQLGAATSSPLRNLDTYLQGQPTFDWKMLLAFVF